MSPFLVLNIQSVLTLIVFALIARWYIVPRLTRLPLEDALIPLIWIHVFRYVPLTVFLPGQVSPELPRGLLSGIAYGDLLSGLLALAAVLMLRYRASGAITVAWLFNVVGVADIVNALVRGVGAGLYRYPLGFNWYVLAFYVPVLIVTHAIMITWLARRSRLAVLPPA